MHDKDTEGETKSICSCVFYAACRSYLGSDRPHKTYPAGSSFLGERWAGNASLETGIQVDLSNRIWPLFSSGMTFRSLLNNHSTLCARGEARGPALKVKQEQNAYIHICCYAVFFFVFFTDSRAVRCDRLGRTSSCI